MERLKKIGRRLLFPHLAVTILLVILCAGLLAWVFLSGYEQTLIAYPIYVLSAYTLTVSCTKLIPQVIKWVKEGRRIKNALDAEEKERHRRFSLYRSLLINLAFGLFKIVTGAVYQSPWLGSVGLYYIVLSLVRFVIVRYEWKLMKIHDEDQKLRHGWNCYQICGFLLLLLNLTMTGVVFQIIWQGMGSSYPELVVYAVAAYTFYRMTIAIIHVVQSRKNTGPILAAARNLDLSAALMSMYTLQTAMFSAFGSDFAFQHLMNSLTGGAVCLIVVCGALAQVLHGRKIKKRLTGGKENGE